MELWDKQNGKVFNNDWQSIGAVLRIVTFKHGEWVQRLMRCGTGNSPRCTVPEYSGATFGREPQSAARSPAHAAQDL